MNGRKVAGATIQIVWLLVEVLAIVRSSISTYNVTMSISGGDTLYSYFTVAVVELSLFALLMLAGSEPVAPIAALVLIAFSGVLQFAEIGILTNTLDNQSRELLRYAIAFSPTCLLLVGLLKRLTSDVGGIVDAISGVFNRDKSSKSLASSAWVENRKVKRWRDDSGRKHSKYLPTGQKGKLHKS